MQAAYERMILDFCKWLDGAGGTVISANTTEGAIPPVFAQTPGGELAFYFVLPAGQDRLTEEQGTAFLEAAKHHAVLPLLAHLDKDGSEPRIERM